MDNKIKNCYKKEDIDTKIKFYQIPKFLIHSNRYKQLGLGEKMVYGILRDRLNLSANNNWVDKNNFVFLKYDQNDLAELLCIARKTVGRYLKNLEKYNLIVSIRAGQGRSNKIYITDISKEIDNSYKYDSQREGVVESIDNTLMRQKVTLRRDNKLHQDEAKCSTNNTNINNTDTNNTIHLSIVKSNNLDRNDRPTDKDLKEIYKNCNLEIYCNGYVKKILECTIKELFNEKEIKVKGKDLYNKQIIEKLKQLNPNIMDSAIRKFETAKLNRDINDGGEYFKRVLLNEIDDYKYKKITNE